MLKFIFEIQERPKAERTKNTFYPNISNGK